jgi:hypothetical protein
MPEAAMDQDSFAVPRKYHIWPARKIFPMEAEAIAHAVQQGPHHKFRFGVAASDAAHEPRALVGPQSVNGSLRYHSDDMQIIGLALAAKPIMILPKQRH